MIIELSVEPQSISFVGSEEDVDVVVAYDLSGHGWSGHASATLSILRGAGVGVALKIFLFNKYKTKAATERGHFAIKYQTMTIVYIIL